MILLLSCVFVKHVFNFECVLYKGGLRHQKIQCFSIIQKIILKVSNETKNSASLHLFREVTKIVNSIIALMLHILIFKMKLKRLKHFFAMFSSILFDCNVSIYLLLCYYFLIQYI